MVFTSWGWRQLLWDEPENAFVAHVEEQVDDAEVGQEAVAAGIDLIVGVDTSVAVVGRQLRTDGVAAVVSGVGTVGRIMPGILTGEGDAGADVEQLAKHVADGFVEVEQVFPPAFKEGAQVVLVVFKERAVAVGRHDGVPVQMPPVTVVADADVADCCALTGRRRAALYGNDECQRAVGGGDDTAVAVRLFLERLALLNNHLPPLAELAVPLDRAEVSGAEQYGGHGGRNN